MSERFEARGAIPRPGLPPLLLLLALWSCAGEAVAPNTAPTAAITAPADGSVVSRLDMVTLQGAGTDAEDGPLGGGSLAWSSQIDAALGTGTSVVTTDLSVGIHAITLTATDSQGLMGIATVAIEVALRAAEVSIPAGTSVPGCETVNQCFIPDSVTVDVGGTVTWSNDDTAAHTVTSGSPAGGPDGVFDSGLFLSGGEFAHTFLAAGSFDYFCQVHPWQIGKVVVE